MSRFHSYIRTAQQVLKEYDGNIPFAHFIKQFFAREKKYGSTDRRQISALCYDYYRVAKALGNVPDEDTLVTAFFLCESRPGKLLEVVRPEWNEHITRPVKEKLAFLQPRVEATQIFPFEQALSKAIDTEGFILSFLSQPDLFLRERPGYEQQVERKIADAGIAFTKLGSNCLALPNGSRVEEVVQLNKEVVVQDYSSQQTGAVMQQFVLNHLPEIHCWDCCAASGGKSLMLHDLSPGAKLTVSDIRQSILHNLQQRFQQAGIRHYQSFVADVSKPVTHINNKTSFNMIVADVPCTGSGTWARTPEQSYFFSPGKIDDYAVRQLQIAKNVLPFLQANGFLVYITCSVFYQENEAVVAQLQKAGNLRLLTMQYLQGFAVKADTLFIAVLQKQA